jgi:bifunctional non-homologous end joining protein LigD
MAQRRSTTAGRTVTRHVGGRPIEVSNPDKVYFPDDEVTKGDVVDYYARIATTMLPHVQGRPLVLQRFPDGITGAGFYQKNTPDHVPEWISRCELAKVDETTTRYSVAEEPATLAYLANQGAVTFHTLLVEAAAPDRPVEVNIDLDPAGDDVAPVRRAAAEVRAVLEDLDLAPRVKSSGSRGLHVVVDVLDADADFELTGAFSRRVAEVVAERGPFTLEHRKQRRGDRLFLDVLRNAPASHAVAPYSLRPLPGAPVAAPLHWEEALAASFDPRRITIDNVFRRLGQTADPWASAPAPGTTIADALEELGSRSQQMSSVTR